LEKIASQSFPKKGEIWWVKLPNQPVDPHQPRTAIIVSRDSRNAYAEDCMVVPTFSNITINVNTHVVIPEGQGGLKHESIAKCEQLTTLHKSLLVKGPLGDRINEGLMWRIHHAVRRALGEVQVP
jgi:mRNA-degrading endonuclease toxin of MazEF toxin-antitoxin module